MGNSTELLARVQAALGEEDYASMRQLLREWQKLEPRNPWLHFYVARWYEGTEKYEEAEKRYRQLLKGSDIPKVITQSRQGLKRLEQRLLQLKQQAIAAEKATADGEEYGLFIIEPIALSAKKEAAQHFAEVMQTDVYSASLQLPTKSWRLFRTGTLGELRFYANALLQGNIPGFCLSVEQLKMIQVLQVRAIQQLEPELVVQCVDMAQQEVTLTFDWTDIHRTVEGLIPLFEESLEKDSRGKSYYKTKVLDYAQFWDLHVGDRYTILRLNDQHYQFKQGIPFLNAIQNDHKIEQHSIRQNWNNLKTTLTQKLANTQTWTDFKAFAPHTADFPELLRKIEPHTHLFRQEAHKTTHWDPAWQLYSTIVFAKSTQESIDIISAKN
jgi:hypothetical protein